MASPSVPISSDALEQWRAAGGERLTFSEVGWSGAAVALIAHASLHFFSVAIPALERLLVVFAPPERLAFGLGANASPLATWLVLLVVVAVWGALIGVVILAVVHEATDVGRRVVRRALRPRA